jgi:hypothetical protein
MIWRFVVTRSAAEICATDNGQKMASVRGLRHGVPANRMILSVVEEIRLEVDVTAKE